MSGDAVHAVEGLAERVRKVSRGAVRHATLRDRLAQDVRTTEQEIVDLTARIEMLAKVGELFRHLMDLMVVKQVRIVEDVVTEGLQSIFHDQVLDFEADVSTKWNKIAVEFYIRRGGKENPLAHRGKPLESFGGGPSSVSSLALRILTVLRLKLWPFLALDEALGAVSPEYVPQTGQFLQTLAAKLGFDVMLITQVREFAEHADVVYTCSEKSLEDGSTCLVIGGAA